MVSNTSSYSIVAGGSPWEKMEFGGRFNFWKDHKKSFNLRSFEIGCSNIYIALKFSRRIDSFAAETPAKLQSD